jgi:hypothetical protein
MWKGKFLTQKSVWKSLLTFPPIYAFFNFCGAEVGLFYFSEDFYGFVEKVEEKPLIGLQRMSLLKSRTFFQKYFLLGWNLKGFYPIEKRLISTTSREIYEKAFITQ